MTPAARGGIGRSVPVRAGLAAPVRSRAGTGAGSPAVGYPRDAVPAG
jgi:hypothetical protein